MSSINKGRPLSVPISFKRPKLFGPSFTRRLIDGDGAVTNLNGQQVLDSNIESSASFRFDPPGAGLRSTQQISIDWSKFENHTFFNSAEANVNIAFDRIINEYPFDGSRKELEKYLDDLTGFEKWVLDSFPKSKGFLRFLKTLGSFISVKDFEGSDHLALAKNASGAKVLDPGMKSFTIEMHVFSPEGSGNFSQVLCQNVKESPTAGSFGYTVGLLSTVSSTNVDAGMIVTSGSLSLNAKVNIPKGEFVHLAFVMNRTPGVNIIEVYKDGELQVTSSNSAEFGNFGFIAEPFLIGSGTEHFTFDPGQTLDGAIDELRVFHSARNEDQLKKYKSKNIFQNDDLKLYFKFNEPTGSLGDLTNIVLDSSGNSLHSYITSFTGELRNTGSLPDIPMTGEKLSLNPILFPGFDDVLSLNTELLASASKYDSANPNLITKLVPNHYFLEGQNFEGFENEDGTIGDSYTGATPRDGKLGSAQLLSSFLFVWAKYFDEIKIFIDQMSNVLHVDYDTAGSVADQFLPMVFKYHGFEVPTLFTNATLGQFIEAEDIGVDPGFSNNTLQQVQNQIWRRILVNLGEIIRSKGTIHSVKSLIRAAGINPDSTIKLREFGGPTKKSLSDSREAKTEIATLLNFSGSLANVTEVFNAQGVPEFMPFIQSGYLSSSRLEVGFPEIAGSYIGSQIYPLHGISNLPSDGLHTSGSWTFEGIYKFGTVQTGSHPVTQSLARMCVTGTIAAGPQVWSNLLAMSGTTTPKIKLITKTVISGAPLELSLEGVNIFDGNQWNVSFGRNRSDQVNQAVSSSWFLRAGRQHMGEITETFVTTSLFYEEEGASLAASVLQRNTDLFNASGSFITIGPQEIGTTALAAHLLNSTTEFPGPEARYTDFSGKTGWLRFWSKGLTVKEWESHVLNFKSLGVETPSLNFGFNTQMSGAFERLRLDTSTDQQVTQSDSLGNIRIFDFSQNNIHMSGTGFEVSKEVISPEIFRFSFISPKFDEASSINKIRIRGYQEQSNVDKFEEAEVSPVYKIKDNEKPNDDTRFTIDFSIVDALNEDIIKIFATLDSLDNALGNPELLYADDYPELESLREVYFNRLTEKINLKGFFEFFRWFDGSIGMFIEQLLPRKTEYLGTNFVIESHMLERPKVKYESGDAYMDESLRLSQKVTIVDEPGGSVNG